MILSGATLTSARRVLVHSNFFVGIRRVKVSTNSICYILGNGPSLKENLLNDSTFLQSQELFAVNDFAKSKYYEILKPKYYVFADPAYWNPNVYKDIYDEGVLVLNEIHDKTDWQMFLIVPAEAFHIFKRFFNRRLNIKILPYNPTMISGFQKINFFFYECYLGMVSLQNVLIACITIAVNMGFGEINLLGADHSWIQDLIVNNDNVVCAKDSHFYSKGQVEYLPYRNSNANGDCYKMHELLSTLVKTFQAYHVLREYADSRNVKIFNRTPNSFIDAFERKPFGNFSD